MRFSWVGCKRAIARAAIVTAWALPAAADQGLLFAGVRDGTWGLWHRNGIGELTEIHAGETRGPVARAGWLAYADPAGAIHLGPTDGTEPSIVTDLPQPCGQPTLAPDGATLVVACFRFANRQDDGALYTVSLPDRSVTLLFDGAGLQKSPAFSPDGQRLAFVSGFRLNAERVIEHIWIIDADGQNARPIADISDVNIDVDWSGTNTVIFASDQGGDGIRLWQTDVESGQTQALTNGPADMETSVSGTGQVAFVGVDGDAFRLMTQPIGSPDQRKAIVVTADDGFSAAHDPFWTDEYE